MCRDNADLAVERLKDAIFWYYWLAAFVASLALGVLAATYVPNTWLAETRDKTLGTLFSVFFGALSGVSLKEIQGRKDKILLIEFVKKEYDEIQGPIIQPQSLVAVESHCKQVLEKVLGG